jgi:proteic killer suppression protein
VVIRSFADKSTARLFEGEPVRHVQSELARRAQRKLRLLHRARSLGDVAANPGNRLEKLSGDREGQWSIRVTDQWRICFLWLEGNAHEVWFGDYHS